MLTRQQPRPLCENCKVTLSKSNGISKHGFKKWHKYCVDCSKAAYNPKHGYILHKKNKCEKCNSLSCAMINKEIIKMPKYLIIALKRYTNSNQNQNGLLQKIEILV